MNKMWKKVFGIIAVISILVICILLVYFFYNYFIKYESEIQLIQQMNDVRAATEPSRAFQTGEKGSISETIEYDTNKVSSDGKYYDIGTVNKPCQTDRSKYCTYGYFNDSEKNVSGISPINDTVFEEVYIENDNYVLEGTGIRTVDKKITQENSDLINYDQKLIKKLEENLSLYMSLTDFEFKTHVKVVFNEEGEFIKEYEYPFTYHSNSRWYNIFNSPSYFLPFSDKNNLTLNFYYTKNEEISEVELVLVNDSYENIKEIKIPNFSNYSIGWPYYSETGSLNSEKYIKVTESTITIYYRERSDYSKRYAVTVDSNLNIVQNSQESDDTYVNYDLEPSYFSSIRISPADYFEGLTLVENNENNNVNYENSVYEDEDKYYITNRNDTEILYSFEKDGYKYVDIYYENCLLENSENYKLLNKELVNSEPIIIDKNSVESKEYDISSNIYYDSEEESHNILYEYKSEDNILYKYKYDYYLDRGNLPRSARFKKVDCEVVDPVKLIKYDTYYKITIEEFDEKEEILKIPASNIEDGQLVNSLIDSNSIEVYGSLGYLYVKNLLYISSYGNYMTEIYMFDDKGEFVDYTLLFDTVFEITDFIEPKTIEYKSSEESLYAYYEW